MLNRLMFGYFIQRKGFLDNDPNYLRSRLNRCQQERGKEKDRRLRFPRGRTELPRSGDGEGIEPGEAFEVSRRGSGPLSLSARQRRTPSLRETVRASNLAEPLKCGANRRARLVKLIGMCGPLDLDDPRPAITVVLPDED